MCLWGHCKLSTNNQILTVHPSIFAVPLRDEAREKRILGMCPSLEEFRSPSDGLLRLCCPADSIDDIVEQSSAATGILSRCPSCLRNFMTAMCHIGCSASEWTTSLKFCPDVIFPTSRHFSMLLSPKSPMWPL